MVGLYLNVLRVFSILDNTRNKEKSGVCIFFIKLSLRLYLVIISYCLIFCKTNDAGYSFHVTVIKQEGII